MTAAEVYPQWIAAKSGVVGESDAARIDKGLTERQISFAREHDGVWCRCPCGVGDHFAWRAYYSESFSKVMSPVLTCFVTKQQWLVRPPDVQGMIRGEEESYIALLRNAPSVVRKYIRKHGWSEQTKALLLDTHGIDHEVSEAIVAGTW